MRRGTYRPSKKTVFSMMMVLATVMIFLPPTLTDAIKHSTQLFVPLQDLSYYTMYRGSKSISRMEDPQIDQHLRSEAMMHQIMSQAGMIDQLRLENRRLGALRKHAVTRALSAQVVARDVAGWRHSLLVERGSERGIHREDWVSSRLFINQGFLNNVQTGQAVIAREVLLGRVEHVSPYMSRVQLFTDIDSAPIEVRIGRMKNGVIEFTDYPCSLKGTGRGKMIIQDVDYRYVQSGDHGVGKKAISRIGIGDYVCSAPDQLGLPAPMVIGRVSAIAQDPKRRLVYDVIVEPAVSVDGLRTVHVIPLVPIQRPIE